MRNRLSRQEISDIFRLFLKSGTGRGEAYSSLVFYDTAMIGERISELRRLFPDRSLHTSAVKANPLKRVMEYLAGEGIGFEAASLPELRMSIDSGADSSRIVFDSPAKTAEEIRGALAAGVHINADSLPELDRIRHLRRDISSGSRIGIRVNPQTGEGAILSTSVAGDYSKFGIPVKSMRDELIRIYSECDWVSGIHLHTGSQGCSLEQLVSGVRIVLDLALEINSKSDGRITIFDIGGGLPVQYRETDPPVTMAMYRETLGEICPELFDGHFMLITEFGRYLHANSGWAVSKVEYVKEYDRNTVMIHLGADMFLRKCYNPDDWHHDIFVTDRNGRLREEKPLKKYTIAGPLCFAGDIIGRDVPLPEVREGDHIIVRDTGAYTLSLWSRYNSRQMPAVIGYTDPDNFIVLKEKETVGRVLDFWS